MAAGDIAPVNKDSETENTVMASFTAPEIIQAGEYNIDENRIEIYNRFGEVYYYVAVSVFAALKYISKHPNEGILYPEQLDTEEVISYISPYLPVISWECRLLEPDKKET